MNIRIVLLLVAALVVAGLTAILARNFLQQSQPDTTAQDQQETTRVIVAGANLPMGHIIEVGDLAWQTWPQDNLYPNYLEEEEATLEDLAGRVVRYGISAGEPMTNARVIAPGERGFLAAILAPGMRAVTISVTRTSGIAGFIFPGDRVDLILTHVVEDGNNENRQVGETILKNVRVLAVDTRTDDQNATPELGKSVTIEVTPKIAEKISVVQRLGQISLSLRSITRPDGTTVTALSPDELQPISTEQTHTWDAEVSRLLPPLAPKKNSVVIARGSNVQVVDLDNSRQ